MSSQSEDFYFSRPPTENHAVRGMINKKKTDNVKYKKTCKLYFIEK